MDHADNPVLHGHDWAVAAWTILAMAAVLGIASNQTWQMMGSHFQVGERSIASAAREVATTAKLAVRHSDALPIVLTVPFAVTRTQRMMVARVKHRADFASRIRQLRSEKAGPGLVAGLALMGASQSSSQ